MNTTIIPNTRNLTLECCKLIAACFVVFLHIPFPGIFGDLLVCLSRFAVPLFFAVSGWFSWGVKPKKLLHRLKHILLLELSGDCLYFGWRWVRDVLRGESLVYGFLNQLPDLQALKMWLLWNVDPFGGHLWYLSATALCYVLLWISTRLQNKRKQDTILYVSGAVLLAVCFAMSEFSRFTGLRVDYRIYRSGIFLGFPVFLLGRFLRQYGRGLPGIPLAMAGLVLSILEWQVFGRYDLYIGSVLLAAGLLLQTDRHPMVPDRLHRAAASFGSISTGVYLVHLLLQEIYVSFFQELFRQAAGPAEPWLQPGIILTVSLLIGFLFQKCKKCTP